MCCTTVEHTFVSVDEEVREERTFAFGGPLHAIAPSFAHRRGSGSAIACARCVLGREEEEEEEE